ncbi:ribonuclease HII [Lachnoclostridium sp. Marseille-P6806]|uniref:ribonuclease HII n=1 Tax=Lachnoclostridium sp. Marseille-P6806 TaxID=2364793 RepID=UPI00102F6010
METIREIRERFQAASENELPLLIEQYGEDGRNGVRALAARAGKRLAEAERERKRVADMRAFELRAASGYLTTGFLCGIDEAGRGPLAGPVAAGAVILPPDHELLYLNDSKKLSAGKREELYDVITREAVSWAVGFADPGRIDEINILQASYEAMRSALSRLDPQPEVLVNDAVRIPGVYLPQVPVVKGDALCLSVAAASILAKVARDRIMQEYDLEFPEYGFAENKGYGSARHIEALKKYGPCPIHRRSFIRSFTAPDSAYAGKGPWGRNLRALGTGQEERAAQYLQGRGLAILEHSFRTGQGEIDLIAREADGTLVFAEVKYRGSDRFGCGEDAVNGTKQKRISRASDVYRAVHGLPESESCRYDVIAIDDSGIRWIRNAFPYRGV